MARTGASWSRARTARSRSAWSWSASSCWPGSGQPYAKAASERERLRRILDQAPVAVGMLQGPEHRIAYVNPRMCALLGQGAEALMGAPIGMGLPGEVATLETGLEHVWRTRTPFVGSSSPFTSGERMARWSCDT